MRLFTNSYFVQQSQAVEEVKSAVTSIWPIKGRVDRVIDYARNPEKTTEASRKKLHEIESILDYAADEMKTEQCQYVTGINVNSVETAAKEFMHTKWMEGKTDGRVCFHGYQSFREGEVDAETTHKIGVTLARELWGDRFQVIVATHCNTNHYHSHFVINSVSSVSEVDGKKFRNSPADYRRMREVSDRVCKEFGLSVIKHPEGRGKTYGEVVAEREGKPTRRGIIKADLDRAIEASLTEQEFWAMLCQLGYEIKLYGKGGNPLAHPAIKPQGSERYFRLDRLGEGYSLDEIMGRVYHNRRRKRPIEEPTITRRVAPVRGSFSSAPKLKGLRALYLRYCCELHIIVKHPSATRRVHPALWEDLTKLNRLDAQTRLLASQKIKTMPQLLAYRDGLQEQITALVTERTELRNLQKREKRAGREDPVSARIAEISAQLRKLRKKVKLCSEIETRSTEVADNLKEIQQEKSEQRKEKEQHELFRRSRAGRADLA